MQCQKGRPLVLTLTSLSQSSPPTVAQCDVGRVESAWAHLSPAPSPHAEGAHQRLADPSPSEHLRAGSSLCPALGRWGGVWAGHWWVKSQQLGALRCSVPFEAQAVAAWLPPVL